MGRRAVTRVLVLLAASLVGASARADDDSELRGMRIGFVPGIGAGVAQFTGQRPYFPSFVGYTVAQIEFLVDMGKWGGFLRGEFVSSGGGGRWTSPSVVLGPTYRFKGDGEERWGIVGRAGLVYQRWHATSSGGCDVPLLIPTSCQYYPPPTPPGTITDTPPVYTTTVDHIGALAGVSLEAPVESVFVAIGAELGASVDVDNANPGLAFFGQLTLSLSLRDHLREDETPKMPTMRHRFNQDQPR